MPSENREPFCLIDNCHINFFDKRTIIPSDYFIHYSRFQLSSWCRVHPINTVGLRSAPHTRGTNRCRYRDGYVKSSLPAVAPLSGQVPKTGKNASRKTFTYPSYRGRLFFQGVTVCNDIIISLLRNRTPDSYLSLEFLEGVVDLRAHGIFLGLFLDHLLG